MQMKFTTNTRETKLSSSQNFASSDRLKEEDIQSIIPFQKYLNMVPDKTSPKKVSTYIHMYLHSATRNLTKIDTFHSPYKL